MDIIADTVTYVGVTVTDRLKERVRRCVPLIEFSGEPVTATVRERVRDARAVGRVREGVDVILKVLDREKEVEKDRTDERQGLGVEARLTDMQVLVDRVELDAVEGLGDLDEMSDNVLETVRELTERVEREGRAVRVEQGQALEERAFVRETECDLLVIAVLEIVRRFDASMDLKGEREAHGDNDDVLVKERPPLRVMEPVARAQDEGIAEGEVERDGEAD